MPPCETCASVSCLSHTRTSHVLVILSSVLHFPSVILLQTHPSTDWTMALTPLSHPNNAFRAAVRGLVVKGDTVTNGADITYWNKAGTLCGPLTLQTGKLRLEPANLTEAMG